MRAGGKMSVPIAGGDKMDRRHVLIIALIAMVAPGALLFSKQRQGG